jgi:hypothetical protein
MSLRPVKEVIHTSQPSKVPASLRNALLVSVKRRGNREATVPRPKLWITMAMWSGLSKDAALRSNVAASKFGTSRELLPICPNHGPIG